MCDTFEESLDKFRTEFLINIHTKIFTDLKYLIDCFRIGAAHFL